MMTKKIPANELPIHRWFPADKGQPYLARIGDLPMVFFGRSMDAAVQSAQTFIDAEVAKHRAAAERAARLASPRAAAQQDQDA